jgi:predicted DNA-binding transcriptional regulator AlpA
VKTTISPDSAILVDAANAAALCGISRSTWLAWDKEGQCPRSVKLGGRRLWCRQVLEKWAAQGCPDRAAFEQAAQEARP